MNHEQRRAKGRTHDQTPSLTDQSQARETDINVIVGRFGLTNTMPTNGRQALSGDFTNLPKDLRGFIEQAKAVDDLRKRLPPQLRDKTPEELAALTGRDLVNILKPADEPKPEPKKEETK